MAQTAIQTPGVLPASSCTALDPLGAPVQSKQFLSMAPRLDSLQGKTVYLVDVGFAGGYEFLEEVRGWLGRNIPSARAVLKHKPGNMFMDAPDLWAEIKDQANAVIFGVGG